MTRMKATPALLGTPLVLFALLAPGASAADGSAACTAIRLATPDAPAASARRSRKKPTFSASQILDLELQVKLARSVKEGGNVELKLYTPKGHLYQSLVAAVSAEASETETNGRRRSKRTWATATLPVAGTTIVTSSLYGTWRIEAHLDGNSSPCGRAQEFVIEP